MLLTAAVSADRAYKGAEENCQLYDPDGLFEAGDQMMLSDMIQETSDAIDMYVAVYVLNNDDEVLSDYDTMVFADDTYDAMFNMQYGEESDGVILVMNMPGRYNYLSTCGMAQLYFSNAEGNDIATKITSNMIQDMRDENYYGAIERFCVDLKYYYGQGVPSRAYTYDYDTGLYHYEVNGELVASESLPLSYRINVPFLAALAAAIGALSALITVLIVKSRYNLKKSLDPTNYVNQRDTHFYQQDDIFLREHTTKTRNSSSSGGGGGGSSHSSSGGFSHGGGGSHW
ncbi:MAG: TPM domain-containing protein [Oscillospiraceae bacterium]|nr:TPM domain-containing protein [Oscillospiraceae bacterium]